MRNMMTQFIHNWILLQQIISLIEIVEIRNKPI